MQIQSCSILVLTKIDLNQNNFSLNTDKKMNLKKKKWLNLFDFSSFFVPRVKDEYQCPNVDTLVSPPVSQFNKKGKPAFVWSCNQPLC